MNLIELASTLTTPKDFSFTLSSTDPPELGTRTKLIELPKLIPAGIIPLPTKDPDDVASHSCFVNATSRTGSL